ncbi:LLM class flavin-dependent oxidoreductase [Actinocatenispora rupis]|uniref:Monooxygenase n=1 Tax=Actinocatenispora rupis TaxID=519421 RepID=A0A8J3NFX9_9ACTN|nr:LLM class flavin-dependent oxidoreductase [Actinocatenispora rupis]GID15787.1 monooxygenase [Actinocatenispora rupis]
MRIGIGLPNPVPDTPGVRLVEWARRAEDRGFAALATIDRVVFPSYDSLTALAVAAGATSRIGLTTNILLAPVYQPLLLAKTAASLDQLSGGRLTLGLGVGGRPDDFAAVGRDPGTRGRDFDAGLDLMHRAWRGEPVAGGEEAVCPIPVNDRRVPILVGGTSDAAIRRTVEWGAGWTIGGAPPEQAAPLAERIRTAWRDAGRDGEPRLAALTYFALGPDAEADSWAYLRRYYGFTGEYAERIASGARRTEAAVADAVRAFSDAGFTELYFDPATADLDQVDRLADVVAP